MRIELIRLSLRFRLSGMTSPPRFQELFRLDQDAAVEILPMMSQLVRILHRKLSRIPIGDVLGNPDEKGPLWRAKVFQYLWGCVLYLFGSVLAQAVAFKGRACDMEGVAFILGWAIDGPRLKNNMKTCI